MEKQASVAIAPGQKYAICLSVKCDGRRAEAPEDTMRRIAAELVAKLPCAVACYAARGRLVIVAEERERKRYRDALQVTSEAACAGSVALNREMFRMNTFGFFTGRSATWTMPGEIFVLGHDDGEEAISAAIIECFGEEMKRVV